MKEEIVIDWNRKIFELEQRLKTVELELQQVKQASQLQVHKGMQPLIPNDEGYGTTQPIHESQNTQQPYPNQAGQQHLANQTTQQPYPNQAGQQHFANQAHQQPYANQGGQQHFANQATQQSHPNQAGQQHFANQAHQQPFTNQAGQQHLANQATQQPYNIHSAQQLANQQNRYQPPMNDKRQSGNLESVLVKIVLPIVFIVVLLIGVLMLFVAGVAYGLITEPVRCLLGVLLAASMYVVGLLQHSYKRPIWGKSLLGGAHGIFIITVSVAHLSYEIIGVALSAVLYAIAFGLIIFSALRWNSQLLVTIAIVSGYLCMFLIDYDNVHALSFIIIQLAFSVSMILLSTKLNYRVAFGFAYMLLHLSLLITYSMHEYESQKYILAALIIQHLVLFVPYMKQKAIHFEQLIAQIIGILIIIGWSSLLYNSSEGISWIYAVVTLAITIVYGYALFHFRSLSRDEQQQQLQYSFKLRSEVSAIITALSLFCFFVEIAGSSFVGLILFLIGVALVLYGLRDEQLMIGSLGNIVTLLGAIIIVFDVPNKLLSYEVLSWVIMLIIIPIVYRELYSSLTIREKYASLLRALLWVEAALLFIFVTIIANLIGDQMSSNAEPYMVSLSWLVYAIGAIVLGSVRKLKSARLTGIILLLVIVVKLIFIDITFLNLLSKSLMFTVLGGIGIVVSFILYNRTDDK